MTRTTKPQLLPTGNCQQVPVGRPAADVKRPTLNMRAGAAMLAAFKATWPGWQTRINAVLRDALAHRVVKS